MKMLDEKGRLFGVINVIDLLVVVLVITLVCAGGVVLLHHGDSIDGAAVEKLPVTIQVRSEKLENEVGEKMKSAVGSTLLSEGGYMEGTVLQNVEVEPYQEILRGEDGKAEYVDDTRYCNVTVTVTAEVETDELPLYYMGAQIIYVGSSIWVKTEFAGIAGTVISMEVQQ